VPIPTSDLSICQAACVHIGATPITAFDDGSAEADVLAPLYEPTVRAFLCASRWRFATVQARLGAPIDATPYNDFDYAYPLPTSPEMLAIDGVFVGDEPVVFDQFDNRIYTNASDADAPVIHYRYRAAEKDFPPLLVVALQYELAGILSIPITQDSGIANTMASLAAQKLREAKPLMQQQRTARRMRGMSRLTRLRRS
jgi:hypothetical protein